ncbi:GMC family oxidoreductase [Hoeflea prorocentri]|uniref:GMC family oxidoreductase N-terminal domain-containing protein n=1 Tax=Hoeflea prorocentri TaxID=1922333 RepID=A0A9X3UJV0_9HYPH|nr:GMC family oxidoreductase N-terminal domain-containing protein [Hoeflea prorocentri]MCY6382178.1 GMC family oxidoreductase N-terminal domain-containing protein [Hoeflea prorocentri]MDA5399978.1 GMC family oxidoreductase N-terminal domain-containing protein [Hoeflea prorocentri]
MTESFDHIVVGGGSAGCVAAARLASEGKAKVLLLEAGHSNRHPLLDMPPGIFKMINGSKYMRYHRTVPQEHLDGRVHDIPQGNVLGGGSSVNAQVYMRGRPSDYDEWDEVLRGNNDRVGWGWDDVLPHFVRMESNNRLNGAYHGTKGPMLVSDPGHIDEFSRWFVQAVQALGEPFNVDFNGASQRGVGFYQFMNRHGKRSSAAYAYVTPQENNPNLTVRLRCEVQKVVVESGRAVGVTYKDKSGNVRTVHCDGEVIVASGALVTPKVLMLSGIGPADQLAQHGISCHADLAGVGQNLIDHPEVPITALANGPFGYYKQGEGWRMLKNGIQFKLFGSGPVTSAGVEAGAFVNPSDPDAPPTIQAFCVPIVYLDRDTLDLVEDGHGLTVTTVVVKPRSRGEVRLASADPSDMPLVSPGLLKHSDDMKEMIAGQRFFLRAFAAHPLADHIERVAIPSPDDQSDKALKAHCKRFVKTNYHPAGSARMGADGDPMAVLDARMRVRGVDGLRVCDMSAVPNINAGNTNAPAMMLGDRCADLVMGL